MDEDAAFEQKQHHELARHLRWANYHRQRTLAFESLVYEGNELAAWQYLIKAEYLRTDGALGE